MDVNAIGAVILGAVAAIFDVATRRIPNLLTFGTALLAIAFHSWTAGLSGLGVSLLGWLVGVVLFFPFFALGGMGAADVKLVGAIGALVGPVAVIWVAVCSAIAGGVLALLVALVHGRSRETFDNLHQLLLFWRVMGPRPLPQLTLQQGTGLRLAYAVPIAAGTVIALWARS